jgi:hypothetical protein
MSKFDKLYESVINEARAKADEVIGKGLPISVDDLKDAMVNNTWAKAEGKYKNDLPVAKEAAYRYIEQETGIKKRDLHKGDLDFIDYLAKEQKKLRWIHPRNR